MGNFDIIHSLKLLPGIILGLTVHEYSHAIVAHWCGDNTSRDQGRISLNPLKHIDPYGFILLFIAGFGWAKPVHFNEKNLHNPKADVMKIAVAGPLSNALVAMILSVILVIVSSIGTGGYGSSSVLWEISVYAIFINWGLFVFNLIPLPPLDGSHLLFSPLKKYPAVYNVLYNYGSWVLFGLIILTVVSKRNFLPIWPLIEAISQGFLGLFGYRI